MWLSVETKFQCGLTIDEIRKLSRSALPQQGEVISCGVDHHRPFEPGLKVPGSPPFSKTPEKHCEVSAEILLCFGTPQLKFVECIGQIRWLPRSSR